MAFISPGNKKKMFTNSNWQSTFHNLSTQIHAKSHFDEVKRPLVIIIHGWRSGAISMQGRAEIYLKMGMHVIIFEMPGHGASEPVAKWTAGHAAVTFHEFFEAIESKFNMDLVSKIFLHGHSMGGFVLLKFNKLTASNNQYEKICGYILESPLTCYSFIFNETIKQLLIPRFLVNQYWKRLRMHFNTVNPKLTSVEDIIEELVGEIEDEHDSPKHLEKKLGNNYFRLSARVEIDYLNQKFKLNIPVSEQYETLGGFIISLNEKIPENDDKIFYNNLMFKIINVSSSKIEIVELIIED